jgi:hypothetical protein
MLSGVFFDAASRFYLSARALGFFDSHIVLNEFFNLGEDLMVFE